MGFESPDFYVFYFNLKWFESFRLRFSVVRQSPKTLSCQGFQSIKQPHQIRKSHRLVRIGWGHSSWSGLRGSNSLPPPWQGGALPDELSPRNKKYYSKASPFCQAFFTFFSIGKSQAKNAVLFQQTILRYFVHFGQHEKATRQSPAGSLCFIVLFPCYFRVLCVRFSLKYERTGAARPPPPSTRPAPCSHSARLKPSLGSCSSRFGFA